VTASTQFGDLFMATPEIAEIEINSFMVQQKGTGIFAVDALVSTRRWRRIDLSGRRAVL